MSNQAESDKPFVVKFKGIFPRRLRVPLQPTVGDKSEETEQLAQPPETDSLTSRTDARLFAFYWKTSEGWKRVYVRDGDLLPEELWKSEVARLPRPQQGGAGKAGLSPHLNVSASLSDTDAALLLSWTPGVSPRDLSQAGELAVDLLVTTEPVPAPKDPQSKVPPTGMKERIWVSVPMIVVLPVDEKGLPDAEAKASNRVVEKASPPGHRWLKVERTGLLSRLGLRHDPRRDFVVRPTRFVAGKIAWNRESGDPASAEYRSALAIDLGAAGLTLSISESGLGHRHEVPWRPFSQLASFSHVTYEPSYDAPIDPETREVDYRVHTWHDSRPPSVVPHRLMTTRAPVPQAARDYANATILIDDAATSDFPSDVEADVSCNEAEYLLKLPESTITTRDDKTTQDQPPASSPSVSSEHDTVVSLEQVHWSIKTEVEQPMGSSDGNDDSQLEKWPAYRFLRGAFNQVVAKIGSRRLESRSLKPIERVIFSYPIHWRRQSQENLRRLIRKALRDSYLHQFLVNPEIEPDPIDSEMNLDEATAAFLGGMTIRLGSLEADELLPILMPFQPGPVEPAPADQESQIHVLVVDCGGSTSNVVLLKVHGKLSGEAAGADGRGGEASVRHVRIESESVEHFGTDRGGLEITRLIASRLKQALLDANPAKRALLNTVVEGQPHELLRRPLLTYVRDHLKQPPTPDMEATLRKFSVGQYRRLFALRLFREAERLKIAVSQGQTQPSPRWDRVIVGNLLETPKNQAIISREILEGMIDDVYGPVVDKIRQWMEKPKRQESDQQPTQSPPVVDYPPLQMILFTGRSAELPGLRDKIIDAIPVEKRPPTLDMACGRELRLEPDLFSPGSKLHLYDRREQAGKTVVVAGLVQNYFDLTFTCGRGIQAKPIDQKRRTRCFGRLAHDITTGYEDKFDKRPKNLLVRADNGTISENGDLVGPLVETNPTSRGFWIGMSFDEPNPDRPHISRPVPYLHVSLEGGESNAFQELRFFFRQELASVLKPVKVELVPVSGNKPEVQTVEAEIASPSEPIQVGPITIRFLPEWRREDFRETGIIHREGDPPIDQV